MSENEVPADFTLDQLLAYLGQQEEEVARGYRTREEWAEYFGISPHQMLRIIHEARTVGILLVTKDWRFRVNGTRQRQPVYSFELERDES